MSIWRRCSYIRRSAVGGSSSRPSSRLRVRSFRPSSNSSRKTKRRARSSRARPALRFLVAANLLRCRHRNENLFGAGVGLGEQFVVRGGLGHMVAEVEPNLAEIHLTDVHVFAA